MKRLFICDEWKTGMHAYIAEDRVFPAMNHRARGEADFGGFSVNCGGGELLSSFHVTQSRRFRGA